MSKPTLRLDTRRALKDGTYPVQIKVGYGTNLYLATGIYIAATDWDARLQICTGKQARVINNILSTSLLRVTNRILELRETGQYDTYSTAQLRQMLTDMSLTSPTIGVPTLGQYIEKVGALKSDSTKVSYITTKRRLSLYCDVDSVRFTDMSYAWFEAFIKHMENGGLKRNTVAKYLKVVKTVIKYAEDDGVIINKAYAKVNSRAETDTPMRNLPIETLRRIRDTYIKGKTAIYKDAFMLSFYLIGINMADMLALPKDCIVNGRLNYKRAKTGKNYSIKIWPEAQNIIDKYPGKNHLLSFSENCSCFRYNCNDLLNKLETGLTWYWARYSWANYAVDLDIPKDTISEALGHKHGSNVTGIYIKYSTDKVDKANRRVLDYFAEK
ncbi:site-specific integrase [uncultured Bacteroides sp.]|uniref:site-specific integrase n=1 Tax=uncultured Bacteroides sp. TaxID=162156 RepID=UPI0025D9FF1E|nr:site-specific integrase [uncultured Bacteroides sp.]